MKITFVVNSLSLGGANKVAFDLIKQFREQGIDCSLIAIYESKDQLGRSKTLEELNSLSVKIIELNKNPGKDKFKALLRFNREIININPDVVNTHGAIPNLYAGIRNLFSKQIYTITTLHSGGDDWLRFKDRLLEKLSLFGINRIVSVAEHISHLYQQKFPKSRNKMVIIENGVDTRQFNWMSKEVKETQKTKLEITKETPILINVARMVPLKNHSFLIDIAYQLKLRNRAFKMLFVGNLEEKEYVNELRKKIEAYQLEQEVLLLGCRDDIHNLLQISDVFLFASQFEGFSLALIEAIYSGIPAVCSDITANRSPAKFGEHSYLLPFDTDLWTRKVEEILDMRLSKDISTSTREKDFYYLSLQRVANDYLALCFNKKDRNSNKDFVAKEVSG